MSARPFRVLYIDDVLDTSLVSGIRSLAGCDLFTCQKADLDEVLDNTSSRKILLDSPAEAKEKFLRTVDVLILDLGMPNWGVDSPNCKFNDDLVLSNLRVAPTHRNSAVALPTKGEVSRWVGEVKAKGHHD